MLYEEFNALAGQTADINMYEKEIEPVYMMFEFSKVEIAAIYWGVKPGFYGYWLKAKELYKIYCELNTMREFGFTTKFISYSINKLLEDLQSLVQTVHDLHITEKTLAKFRGEKVDK